MRVRTQEDIEAILPAFSYRGQQGILAEKVLAFWGTEGGQLSSVGNIEVLAEVYTARGYSGIAELVRSLEGNSVLEFGSNCIDFYGVVQGPFSLENMLLLRGVSIGISKFKITPHVWLWCLSNVLDEILAVQLEAFDEICGEFVKLLSVSGKGVSLEEALADGLHI